MEFLTAIAGRKKRHEGRRKKKPQEAKTDQDKEDNRQNAIRQLPGAVVTGAFFSRPLPICNKQRNE